MGVIDDMHLCTASGNSVVNTCNYDVIEILIKDMIDRYPGLSQFFLILKGRIKMKAHFYYIVLTGEQYFIQLNGPMWYSICVHNVLVLC